MSWAKGGGVAQRVATDRSLMAAWRESELRPFRASLFGMGGEEL
jgi:hypothetical protein